MPAGLPEIDAALLQRRIDELSLITEAPPPAVTCLQDCKTAARETRGGGRHGLKALTRLVIFTYVII